jgi:HlyD family secretion protein
MAETRTQKSRLLLWIGAAVVLVAVFVTARYFLRDRLPVRLAQVTHETLLNTVGNTGRVEPVVNYQFFSPIATTVKAVYVQEGDQVPAGKLLITLDDVQARAQVAAAESGVKSAQAALDAATHNGTQAERQTSAAEVEQDRLAQDQAQHDLDALTQLAANGAAARGEVISARERLQTAQASLRAAEQGAQSRFSPAEVARAQAALDDAQAALAAAEHVEAETSIRAPIAGTVYSMDTAASEYAEPGKVLLEMADLRQERVRGFFDEPDLGHLAIGQAAVIRWDARPGREWHGHIIRLPASVVAYSGGTRNVGEVLVDIDGSNDGLLPDTNVTVTVTTSSEENALSIPIEALHEQNGKYFVFKVVNGELKRTPVTIGTRNMAQAPVLAGLEDGDQVATGTTNGQPLQEGLPIKVQQ